MKFKIKVGVILDLLEKLEKKEKSRSGFSLTAFIGTKYYTWLLFSVLSLAVLIAGIVYVRSCRVIYYHDSSEYWDICRYAADRLTSDGFWNEVYRSTGAINYTAAVLPAWWMRIFGHMRDAYVAGIIVLYIIPSYLLTYHLSLKLSKAPRFAFATAVLIMPVMAYLAFKGTAEVGGVLIALACYDMYCTKDGAAGKCYRYIMIGVLLVLIMLFSGYYAYFAVSFFTAMVIDSIIHRRNRLNTALTAVTAVLLLGLFFRDFLTRILLADYENMISGISLSVSESFAVITRGFGLLFIALAAAASAAAVLRRHEYKTIFAWLQCVMCAVMFMLNHAHEEQHMLLYVPALTVITICAVNCISKRWMLFAVCAAAALNVICVNINSPEKAESMNGIALVPSFSMRARHQNGIDEIIALRNTLDAAIPEGSSCSILASSDMINADMLKNANLSVGIEDSRTGDYIKPLTEPDEYGTFNRSSLYYSDFVLAAYPAQTLPGSPGEREIAEAVQSFENNTDIAQFFDELQWFSCSIGDVHLKLYARVREPDSIRKHEFEARLGI